MTAPIRSLKDAIHAVQDLFHAHPDRNGMNARALAATGQRREHAALYLNHLAVPNDDGPADTLFFPPDHQLPDTPEGRLGRELLGLLWGLDMHNPISPCLSLGKGTGTLATAFGIPLSEIAGGTPAYSRPMEELLKDPPPDPLTAGLMPAMLERIDWIKSCLPPFFKINLPDMQGPYNIAHAIAGEDALTGPYIEPDLFRALMERVTDHWIASRRILVDRIGPDYLNPIEKTPWIAECSVNLTRAEIYCEFILPSDRRIVEAFGPPRIHTCSGSHVFRATLENLPLVETECGIIANAIAGYTRVEDAFAAVRGKPILLNIGQELPKDFNAAFDLICRDLDLYADHPRMMFSYSGMDWRRKDRPAIRDLHRRLDAYWASRYNANMGHA